MFDIESIYLTSHEGMSNVPGVVIEGCIEGLSSSSQQLHPDEGRFTIGSMTLTVADLAGSVTDELRSQFLENLAAARGREVRVFEGESDDFTQLTRQETYVIDSVEFENGAYVFSCSDRSRELRDTIFDNASTRLRATLSATEEGLLAVQSTEGFQMVQHTASFSDAPDQIIGYVRIKKTGEIIGYTGIQPDSFTGLVRGRFGTLAQEVLHDDDAEPDRQPEITEFIYLEMPAPQLAYAIMTGVIPGTSSTLPESWHLGVSPSSVALQDFETIGEDLYDPNDFTKGLVLKFDYLTRTDGKRFIEEQLHLLMGTFSPIDENGVIRLRRLTRVIGSSAASFILDADHIISTGALQHDQSAVVNDVEIQYNWDGQTEEYSRTAKFLNGTSIGIYKRPLSRSFSFRGLSVKPHTPSTLRRFFNWLTDRYGGHPIKMTAQVSMLARSVRVGDIVRVPLSHIRDFAGEDTLDRAMEVQGRSINHLTGEIELELAGSAELANEPPPSVVPPIADEWYSAEGTDLSTVLTISSGHVTANGTITGGDDLRSSVFYYVGDLTIDNGVTVEVEDNVQLRILGSLTVNGSLSGVGLGVEALDDPSSVDAPYTYWPSQSVGNTFGTTQSSSGISYFQTGHYWGSNPIGNFKRGLYSVPQFDLRVTSGQLEGLPSELRGTPGVQGAPVVQQTPTNAVKAVGSAGGAGGSGLAIVTRGGLFFGASGEIDLSGADGTAPGGGNTVTLGGNQLYAGGGGGGAPGMLLVVLDGGDVPFPDFGNGAHVANRGSTTPTGNPIEYVPTITQGVATPWRGYGNGFSTEDLSAAARLAVWAPLEFSAGENADEAVPVPSITSVEITTDGALIHTIDLPPEKYDLIEYFASIDNDLANAVKVSNPMAFGGVWTRWVWTRARKGAKFSPWSSGPNDGRKVTAGFPIIPPTTLSNTWSETFDSYRSQFDLLNEWRAFRNGVELTNLSGVFTVQSGGVNGGKVIRCDSLGNTIRLVAKRPIPFDHSALYRMEGRVSSSSTQPAELFIGAFSLGNDGEQIHEGGTLATGTPTWCLLDNFFAFPLSQPLFNRAFSWIAGAYTSQLGHASGGANDLSISANTVLNPIQVSPAFPINMRMDGSGNIPAYILPVIEITDGIAYIDSLRIDRVDTDPFAAGVTDGNFSLSDDGEFWTVVPSPNGLAPELLVGGGENGGNAVRFRNVSSTYNLTVFGRTPIRLNGNTITIAFNYKITDNTSGSPGVNNSSSIRFHVYGIQSHPNVRRRHVLTTPSLATQSKTVGGASLSIGSWAVETVTFSNVYTSSIPDADGIMIAFDARGTTTNENFHVDISRIRVLQT